MKNKTVLSISMLFLSVHMFSQQISDGYAPIISEFNAPLKSGIYQGSNPLGITPDNSSTWQYLFVMRNNITANNYQLQIASSFVANDRLFFRKIGNDTSTSYASWIELATRGNNNFVGNQNIAGNVGIGTTNPKSKLEVTDWTPALTIGSTKNVEAMVENEVLGAINFYKHYNLGYAAAIKLLQPGGGNQFSQAHLAFYTTSGRIGDFYTTVPEERMRITSLGYIGIGTPTPTAPLDIYTNITAPVAFNSQNWSTSNSGYSLKLQTVWTTSGGINQQFIQKFDGVDYTSLSFFQGRVGIGNTSPDEKLTVKGKIHAEEVRIDLSIPAPDYVFANDYKLKTLEEVEAYIKKNNHLPEIPSAQEIEKNGLMLAEMNMALLKKMEEMTLYMIEQEKRLNAQSTEISALKNLEKRLSKLEKNGIKE